MWSCNGVVCCGGLFLFTVLIPRLCCAVAHGVVSCGVGLRDLTPRLAAAKAFHAMLLGFDVLPESVVGDVLKVVQTTAKDKAPEVCGVAL